MIEFKLEGNWSVPGDAFRGMPRMVKKAGQDAQKKTAEKIVKLAKKHIRAQDLGWKPSQKASGKTLIDTGAYYDAIKAWKQGDAYLAGVPLGATNAKGVPIFIYALVHEYGSSNVPRRPLWRPVYQEMGGKKGLAKAVKDAVRKKINTLRNKGFQIT